MSEIKLQSNIAVEFSRRYPKLKGQFFHVSNERNNKIQAFQARAIGIIPGVSDFLYFEKFNLKEDDLPSTTLIGFEVKEPGSRHLVSHVFQQVKWARVLTQNGGRWFLVRSVDEVMNIIEGIPSNALSVDEVEEMLINCNAKTIKF